MVYKKQNEKRQQFESYLCFHFQTIIIKFDQKKAFYNCLFLKSYIIIKYINIELLKWELISAISVQAPSIQAMEWLSSGTTVKYLSFAVPSATNISKPNIIQEN